MHSVHFSVHYVKRPGAVLDAGSILANLQLDDPTKVQQAQLFTGKFPPLQNPPSHGEKLHQLYQQARNALDNILAGRADILYTNAVCLLYLSNQSVMGMGDGKSPCWYFFLGIKIIEKNLRIEIQISRKICGAFNIDL